MTQRWAYDFDGVLAEAPPHPAKKWGYMNGGERRVHRAMLLEHYASARALIAPETRTFAVITARSRWAQNVSEAWLARYYPARWELFMLDEARTIRNVVAFKAKCLRELAATDFAEDNVTVVRALRRAVPHCRVWLYRNGELEWTPPDASRHT